MNQATDRRQFLALAGAAALATRTATGAAAASEPGSTRTVGVLGATGRVGTLIVKQLLSEGYQVVAISRSADKLRELALGYAGTRRLAILQGDVSSDSLAEDLRKRLLAEFGTAHALIASLSSSAIDGRMRILANPTDTLRRAFETNFFTHVTAARALIPALTGGGVYVGINGGLADFPAAGMAQLTTTQSALRALYEVLAFETQGNPRVRVLELFGLVDDGTLTTAQAAMRINGMALGRRIAEIIAQPSGFPGPVLALKSKAFL
jgi:NAD(P)-dependent dehydrogenase (short-subunit alcohol dehydrogenase family)